MTYADKAKQTRRRLTSAEKLYEREIQATYAEALKDVRQSMATIYERYAQDGVLTKANMTQYNRLATLERQLADQLGSAVDKNTRYIARIRPEHYSEAYFRYAWTISTSQEISIRWGVLSREAIIANMANPAYEQAIKTLKPAAIGAMRIAVEQGLAQGKSYERMMRDVRGVFNQANWKTMRIMRTELHTAREMGSTATYEKALDSGVKGRMVWMATLDDRTRDWHGTMDGVGRQDDGLYHGPLGTKGVPGVARYPGDPDLSADQRINCRCDQFLELDIISDIPGVNYDDWIATRKTLQ